MQNHYLWKVIPSGQPTVIKSCSKCGAHSEFESSGNFRINANQSLLDIWLIYQCNKCKSTWNMEIFSRIRPKELAKDFYLKFEKNDPELARQYAFDTSVHSRNKARLCYSNIPFDIIGESFSINELKEDISIKITCEYPLDFRLDKILSGKLCLSREKIKKLGQSGQIVGAGIQDITKAKVRDGMILYIKR